MSMHLVYTETQKEGSIKPIEEACFVIKPMHYVFFLSFFKANVPHQVSSMHTAGIRVDPQTKMGEFAMDSMVTGHASTDLSMSKCSLHKHSD